jgi:hypothetical protein
LVDQLLGKKWQSMPLWLTQASMDEEHGADVEQLPSRLAIDVLRSSLDLAELGLD